MLQHSSSIIENEGTYLWSHAVPPWIFSASSAVCCFSLAIMTAGSSCALRSLMEYFAIRCSCCSIISICWTREWMSCLQRVAAGRCALVPGGRWRRRARLHRCRRYCTCVLGFHFGNGRDLTWRPSWSMVDLCFPNDFELDLVFEVTSHIIEMIQIDLPHRLRFGETNGYFAIV